MSPSLVRHCAPPSYSCGIPRYAAGLAGMCATCSGMLARGDFAQDVAEERYDTEWGNGSAGAVDRFRGLDNATTDALYDAFWSDRPNSPCLETIRVRWFKRSQTEAEWHEAETSDDELRDPEDEAACAADYQHDAQRDWDLVHS